MLEGVVSISAAVDDALDTSSLSLSRSPASTCSRGNRRIAQHHIPPALLLLLRLYPPLCPRSPLCGSARILTALVSFAYLTVDMLAGFLSHRSQIGLLTGWIHHVVYIITEVAICSRWVHISCLAALMELPTFIRGLSTLALRWRSNVLIAVATRIAFHLVLLYGLAMIRELCTPALVYPLHAIASSGTKGRRERTKVGGGGGAAPSTAPSLEVGGSAGGYGDCGIHRVERRWCPACGGDVCELAHLPYSFYVILITPLHHPFRLERRRVDRVHAHGRRCGRRWGAGTGVGGGVVLVLALARRRVRASTSPSLSFTHTLSFLFPVPPTTFRVPLHRHSSFRSPRSRQHMCRVDAFLSLLALLFFIFNPCLPSTLCAAFAHSHPRLMGLPQRHPHAPPRRPFTTAAETAETEGSDDGAADEREFDCGVAEVRFAFHTFLPFYALLAWWVGGDGTGDTARAGKRPTGRRRCTRTASIHLRLWRRAASAGGDEDDVAAGMGTA
ncbi:hypothetical protein C8R45DRAFT_1215465 [Mycena sanguinolenta]|nr:hypothetical protein C8R45DRAFT_1215465 [Mycena sanguinolenta]